MIIQNLKELFGDPTPEIFFHRLSKVIDFVKGEQSTTEPDEDEQKEIKNFLFKRRIF